MLKDLMSNKVRSFFSKLRERKWSYDLSLNDISNLIGSKGRISLIVLRECIELKLLFIRSRGIYYLTKRALAFISNEDFDKKTRSFIKNTKESRSDSLSIFNSNKTKLIHNNIYNIARARSKNSTKKLSKKQLELREKAKKIIKSSKNDKRQIVKMDVYEQKANAIALVYEHYLGIYTNNKTLKYLKESVTKKEPMYKTWLRAAKQADDLNVSYNFYMKAQFFYFDKWYSRCPKPYEIASYKSKNNANERVRLFELENNKNKNYEVIGKVRRAKISKQAIFAQSSRQLIVLMRNYDKSEREILKKFGRKSQAKYYFDYEWLKQNRTYQQLKASGEL